MKFQRAAVALVLIFTMGFSLKASARGCEEEEERKLPRIKVLTFNVWHIVTAKEQAIRAVAIGRKIAELDPDIVAFEEAFNQRRRKILFENLEKGGYEIADYRYVRYVYGSGLLLISKYPILKVRFEPYRVIGGAANIEWLAGKGIIHARLKTPHGPIDFFHTHAIARMTDVFDEDGNYIPGDPQVNDRILHMYQIDRFVRGQRGQRTRSTIAAGDFNVSPEMLEYRLLSAITGFDNSHDRANPERNPSTYSTENIYVTQECSRIDHVFYKNYEGAEGFWVHPAESRVEMMDKFTSPESMETINYSDHYALYTEFEVITDKYDICGFALSTEGTTPSPDKCASCLWDGYDDGTLKLHANNIDDWRSMALSTIGAAWYKQDRKNSLIPLMAEIVTSSPGTEFTLDGETREELEKLLPPEPVE